MQIRTHVRINMVISVLINRFGLVVAAGGSEVLLGRPVALAPPEQGDRRLGEVSASAEAQGVRPGLTLGEALGRCPELMLIPPDPVGAAAEWERVLAALEDIGALLAAPGLGRAVFEASGLLRMHRGLERLLAATSRAVGRPVRLGVAAGQFAATAAAASARPRHPVVVGGGEQGAKQFLAPQPVGQFGGDHRTAKLVPLLERFGINRIGDLAAMSRHDIADRFGAAGIVAYDLAQGRDTRVVARSVPLAIAEAIELPEACGGQQLAHALGLLVARLLARPERDGLTLRSVEVSAELDSGGTWRRELCFRESLADRDRIELALSHVFTGLPAPAKSLRLAAIEFGPPTADQQSLLCEPAAARIDRLRQAILQTRAAAGPDSALRAVEVEPQSRLPERRMALVPFEA